MRRSPGVYWPTLPGGTGGESVGKNRRMIPPRCEGGVAAEGPASRSSGPGALASAGFGGLRFLGGAASLGSVGATAGATSGGPMSGASTCSGGEGRISGSAFAVGQPDVVDRMLDAVQAGAGGEHPAGEDAIVSLLFGDLIDFHEAVGPRRLGRRPCVADARRDQQRTELHRFVDPRFERDDAAGDLVETGENGGGVADPVGRGGAGGERGRDEQGAEGG